MLLIPNAVDDTVLQFIVNLLTFLTTVFSYTLHIGALYIMIDVCHF